MFNRIQLTWTTDPHLVQLINRLEQGTKHSTKFTWQHNQLRHKGKLVVGQDVSLKTDLLTYFDSSPIGGHSRMHPTMAHINGVVYWKGMKKQVRQFVKGLFYMSEMQV